VHNDKPSQIKKAQSLTTEIWGMSKIAVSTAQDDTFEIQSQVTEDHLRRVATGHKGDARTGVTARAAEINV